MIQLTDYQNKYQMIRFERDQDGILLMRLHTDGDSLRWSLIPHRELEQAFLDVGRDRDNQVVIITGTGAEFSGPAVSSAADRSVGSAVSPDDWYWMSLEGKRYVNNMLNIEVPMISAVNGPALRHAIIPVLCDIVLASAEASFQDSAHFAGGLVPGDGHGVIFPFLMGTNRGRYFLMTGQTLSASEARDAGLVNEVMPRAELLPRAYTLARQLLRSPPLVRRYTRVLLTQRLRQQVHEALGFGFAMEGHALAS